MKLTSLPYELVDFREGRFVEEWIAFARKVRLDGLEVLVDSTVPHRRVGELWGLLQASGLEVSMITSNQSLVWPMWSWKRMKQSADETVEHIHSDIALARTLHARLLRLRPAPGWDESWREVSYRFVVDRAAEVAARAAELAEKAGVRLLLENHPCDASVRRSFFDDLFPRVKSKWVGINLDFANASRVEGQDAADFLDDDLIRPRIGYVHVRNFRDTRDGWRESSVDKGELDVPALLGKLKASGYDGWLSFEYSGDSLADVERSVRYIREVWGD